MRNCGDGKIIRCNGYGCKREVLPNSSEVSKTSEVLHARTRLGLPKLLASHVRAGTKRTFAPMNVTLETYRSSNWRC
jgi:hypothetical protein